MHTWTDPKTWDDSPKALNLAWWRVLLLLLLAAGLGWAAGRMADHWGTLANALGMLVFGVWVTPKTWTAVVVTVADLNQHIRDNLNVLATCIDTATGSILVPSGKSLTMNGAMTAGQTPATQFLGNVFALLLGYEEKYQTGTISAGNLTIDIAGGNHVFVTMNANITSITVVSGIFGLVTGYVAPPVLHLVGDGTLRTVTWTVNSTAVRFSNGVAPTLVGTSGKVTRVVLYLATGKDYWGEQIGYNA
jgi:hypothetical protein